MVERFDEFVNERRYLKNVSEAILYWYKASFKTWHKFGSGDPKQWGHRMDLGFGGGWWVADRPLTNHSAHRIHERLHVHGLVDDFTRTKCERPLDVSLAPG